jgi:hypothetical protein
MAQQVAGVLGVAVAALALEIFPGSPGGAGARVG